MSEENKKKEGVSVKEIESYARKHIYEIFFCTLFLFASLFSLVFWGPYLSVLLAGAGAIIGILLPYKIDQFAHKMARKILIKDSTTQLIIAIAALIVSIFLAPLLFLPLGLHAGKSLIRTVRETSHNP